MTTRNSNYVRYTDVTVGEHTAHVQIVKHGDGYLVSVTLDAKRNGRGAKISDGFMPKPEHGTVIDAAREVAYTALSNAIAQARQDILYVVVENLPGYARRHLDAPGMVEAAYKGTGASPVMVFRVFFEDDAAIEAFRAEVDGHNFDMDGRGYGLARVTLTRDVVAATTGRNVYDGITAIALRNADKD